MYNPTPSAPEPEKVKSLFNGISKSYDRFNRFASLGLDKGWRRKIALSLAQEDLKECVLLDIGTGTGELLFDIREICSENSSLTLVGVDFSSEMLKIANEKCKKNKVLLPFINANASRLPLGSRSVNFIVSAFVLRNIKKLMEASLLEMKRTLKEGGKIYLLEMYIPQNRILKFFHRVYLQRILPLWGHWICGTSWSGEYLTQTILGFGSPAQFSEKLQAAGFKNVRFQIMLGGVAVLHTASL